LGVVVIACSSYNKLTTFQATRHFWDRLLVLLVNFGTAKVGIKRLIYT